MCYSMSDIYTKSGESDTNQAVLVHSDFIYPVQVWKRSERNWLSSIHIKQKVSFLEGSSKSKLLTG